MKKELSLAEASEPFMDGYNIGYEKALKDFKESIKELKKELGSQYYNDRAWKTINKIINEVFGDVLCTSDAVEEGQ